MSPLLEAITDLTFACKALGIDPVSPPVGAFLGGRLRDALHSTR